MRFRQLDKITLLEPGKRIQAEKTLTGHEDYLRDHFPRFQVQPGVLMLESLFQAAQFLVRSSEGYQTGLVVLREAKSVKFASFLQPGGTLMVEAEITKQEGLSTTVKAHARNSNGSICVIGRLVIDCLPDQAERPVQLHASKYMQQIVVQLEQAAMAGK